MFQAPTDWAGLGILALAVLIVIVLSAVAFVLHLRYWDRALRVDLPYCLEEEIVTPDGTTIELRRLPLPKEPAPALPPVMLVHGMGANHRNVDCLPDLSLARYLSERGRDVWLVTLRSGLPNVPRVQARLLRFADMVDEDLPVSIGAVLERTRAARLDYVGFSMGGILLYAALERSVPQGKLRRVVFVGSPVVIRPPVWVPRWLLRHARLVTLRSPLRLLARSVAFASEWIRTPLHHLVMNPDNVAPGVARTALANLVADVPAALNLDFVLWAMTDTGSVTLGSEHVLDRLTHVRLPALFIAGVKDRLAPPAAVRPAFEAWGADAGVREKAFVVLALENGARADYGHGDLAIGRHAPEDVFRPIADFLSASSVDPARS